MKLQLALDVLHTDEALRLAEVTHEHVDILEIGTPLIKHEGIRVIEAFRARFPDRQLLVDLKTMDAGAYETGFCFDAGADLITVLGAADDRTALGAMESARRYGLGETPPSCPEDCN
jgi:3-hexulose-6-phosphate synthase